MQCHILVWVLEQKEEISGKTGEIHVKSGVQVIVMERCWFLGSDRRVSWQGKMLTVEENG